MNMKNILALTMVGAAFSISSVQAAPTTYTFQDWNFPPGNIYGTQINGINNAGDKVGQWADIDGLAGGFYNNVAINYTNIPFNQGSDTTFYGINNSGQAIGFYTDSSLQGPTNFIQTGANGARTVINPISSLAPGNANNYSIVLKGLNDNGIVLGQYTTDTPVAGQSIFNFKFNSATNTYSTIAGNPLALVDSTTFIDINNNGWLIGNDSTGAFVYDGTTWTNIIDPNSPPSGTNVSGINNNGIVVGTYVDNGGLAHGFTYDAVSKTFLNSLIDVPGGIAGYQSFNGINDLGQLVGFYSGSTGFVATPAAVPLPAAAWLFGSALMAGLGLSKRRKASLIA